MTVKDHQQVQRASSLPPQHPTTPKPKKVIHSMPSQTIPGDIMRRRNSTPGWMTAQDLNKGKACSQVNSRKMEFKFGMSPLKTQQFSSELIKSQKKTEKMKKELGKPNLESGFGRQSFRLPKSNSNKVYHNALIMGSENNAIINNLKNSQLPGVDNNKMNQRNKVKEWLNEKQRTPRTSLRRSVSDSRDKSRMPTLTQTVGDQKDANIPRGVAAPDQSHIDIKIIDKNKDKEQVAKIVIKTKAIESQPKTLLRRSVSDLKQKSIAARKFLNFRGMRADVYTSRSPMFESVTNNKVLNDKHDLEDISKSKRNIAVGYVEEKDVDLNEKSRQYGSILKRPGNKRKNIKHVEFLENIGDYQENVIRYI